MKIAVISSFEYWTQSHLWLAKSCADFLRGQDHLVDEIHLPFQDFPQHYLEQILAYRSLDLSEAGTIITFGPFAHLIEHNHKICFLTSHLRGFYELWHSPYGETGSASMKLLRNKLLSADQASLLEARESFCFYDKVAKRYPLGEITTVNLPRIPRVTDNSVTSNSRNRIISLEIFSDETRLDLLVKSFLLVASSDFNLTLAGQVKRTEIFEYLKRIGRPLVDKGLLEFVENPSPSRTAELASQADLFVDCSLELDHLSFTAKTAIEYNKPFFGLTDGGVINTQQFQSNKIPHPLPNKRMIAELLNKILDSRISIQKEFSSFYRVYNNERSSPWEGMNL